MGTLKRGYNKSGQKVDTIKVGKTNSGQNKKWAKSRVGKTKCGIKKSNYDMKVGMSGLGGLKFAYFSINPYSKLSRFFMTWQNYTCYSHPYPAFSAPLCYICFL